MENVIKDTEEADRQEIRGQEKVRKSADDDERAPDHRGAPHGWWRLRVRGTSLPQELHGGGP